MIIKFIMWGIAGLAGVAGLLFAFAMGSYTLVN